MTLLLSIDPGKAIGVSYGWYDETAPYRLDYASVLSFYEMSYQIKKGKFVWGDELVVERFIPQSGGAFTLGEDDVAAVEVIGLIKHANTASQVFWHTRADKGPAGMMDGVLKEHGLWKTGSDVNWADGRDVNDSIIHALVNLRNRGHLPTMRKYLR